MIDEIIKTNKVKIIGTVDTPFIFNHEVFGEKFYGTTVKVSRTSGVYDFIPVIISERLIDVLYGFCGHRVSICGQLRSFNRHTDEGNKLILNVFVREFELLSEDDSRKDVNELYFDGYIGKEPAYRKTPFGREITDIKLVVNRPYGKSDYIPCITWGRTARYTSDLDVGTHVSVWGRMQSREYYKKISEEIFENRIAYEVSIYRLELQND